MWGKGKLQIEKDETVEVTGVGFPSRDDPPSPMRLASGENEDEEVLDSSKLVSSS